MDSRSSSTAIQLKTSDFEELREAYRGWDHEYVQLNSGGFQGGVTLFQSESLQLSRNHWGNKIRYRGTSPEYTYGAALTLAQPDSGKWLGAETGMNDVIVQRPGHAAEYLGPDTWTSMVFSIPEANMVASVYALSGRQLDAKELLHGKVRLCGADAQELRTMSHCFFEILSRHIQSGPNAGAPGVSLETMAKQIERRFILSLVSADLEDAAPPVLRKPDLLVRNAESYANSVSDRPVGIMELCDVLVVAERTLHAAFQACLGVSPAAWLRTLRLNRTYSTLRRSDLQSTQVKKIALENGFSHFGQFSRAYKIHFGELPSQTLKKA